MKASSSCYNDHGLLLLPSLLPTAAIGTSFGGVGASAIIRSSFSSSSACHHRRNCHKHQAIFDSVLLAILSIVVVILLFHVPTASSTPAIPLPRPALMMASATPKPAAEASLPPPFKVAVQQPQPAITVQQVIVSNASNTNGFLTAMLSGGGATQFANLKQQAMAMIANAATDGNGVGQRLIDLALESNKRLAAATAPTASAITVGSGTPGNVADTVGGTISAVGSLKTCNEKTREMACKLYQMATAPNNNKLVLMPWHLFPQSAGVVDNNKNNGFQDFLTTPLATIAMICSTGSSLTACVPEEALARTVDMANAAAPSTGNEPSNFMVIVDTLIPLGSSSAAPRRLRRQASTSSSTYDDSDNDDNLAGGPDVIVESPAVVPSVDVAAAGGGGSVFSLMRKTAAPAKQQQQAVFHNAARRHDHMASPGAVDVICRSKVASDCQRVANACRRANMHPFINNNLNSNSNREQLRLGLNVIHCRVKKPDEKPDPDEQIVVTPTPTPTPATTKPRTTQAPMTPTEVPTTLRLPTINGNTIDIDGFDFAALLAAIHKYYEALEKELHGAFAQLNGNANNRRILVPAEAAASEIRGVFQKVWKNRLILNFKRVEQRMPRPAQPSLVLTGTTSPPPNRQSLTLPPNWRPLAGNYYHRNRPPTMFKSAKETPNRNPPLSQHSKMDEGNNDDNEKPIVAFEGSGSGSGSDYEASEWFNLSSTVLSRVRRQSYTYNFACSVDVTKAACSLLDMNNNGSVFLMPWILEDLFSGATSSSTAQMSTPLSTAIALCSGQQAYTYSGKKVCPSLAMLQSTLKAARMAYSAFSNMPTYVSSIMGNPSYRNDTSKPSYKHFSGAAVDYLCGPYIYKPTSTSPADDSCMRINNICFRSLYRKAYYPAQDPFMGCGNFTVLPITAVHCSTS